ncbi:hypothetical protein VKT23_002979 [Stygiomarasmius scandens]|uniref:Uncharacterized protein n=1 Tax=Marasmiellus scandens TaxID=2682957 RepID=A0ABR1JYW5_9AGAR
MERPLAGSTSKTPLITPSASPPSSSASKPSSPFKRPRLSSRTPSVQDPSAFNHALEQSEKRMLGVWSQLAERYSRRIDEDDIVDLVTGKVIKDRGVLRNMEGRWEIGRFADLHPVSESRAGSAEEDEEDQGENNQTAVEEESDDELDSFADHRRAKSSRAGQRAEDEGADEPAITLKTNLPKLRPLDPNNLEDAADLREFLEAESRRKEEMGSEDEVDDSAHEEETEYFSDGDTTDASSVLGHATASELDEDATHDKPASAEGSEDELAHWEDVSLKPASAKSSASLESLPIQSTTENRPKDRRLSSTLQLQTPPNSHTPGRSPALPYTGEYIDYVVPTSSPPNSPSLPPSSPPGGYYPTPSSPSPVQTRLSTFSTSTLPQSRSSPQKITTKTPGDTPRATRSTVPHLDLAEVLRASRSSLSPRKAATPSKTAEKLRQSSSSSSIPKTSKPGRSRSRSQTRQDAPQSAKSKGKQKATEQDPVVPDDDTSKSSVSPKSKRVFDGVEIPLRTSNLKRKRADSSSDAELQLRASAQLADSESGISHRARTPMPEKRPNGHSGSGESDHDDIPQVFRSKSVPQSSLRERRSNTNLHLKDPYSGGEKKSTKNEPDSSSSREHRSESYFESAPDPYYASFPPGPSMYDRNQSYPPPAMPIYDPRAQYIISQAVHQLSTLFSSPWSTHPPPDVYQSHHTYPPHIPPPGHGQPTYTPSSRSRGRSRSVLSPPPGLASTPSSSAYHTPTSHRHSYNPDFSRGTLPPSSPDPDSSPIRPSHSHSHGHSSRRQTSDSSPDAGPTRRSTTRDSSPLGPGHERRRASSLVSRSRSRGRRVSFKADVLEIEEGGRMVSVAVENGHDMDVSPRPSHSRQPGSSKTVQEKEKEKTSRSERSTGDAGPSRSGTSKEKQKPTTQPTVLDVLDITDSEDDEPTSVSSSAQRTRRGLTPGPSGSGPGPGPGRNDKGKSSTPTTATGAKPRPQPKPKPKTQSRVQANSEELEQTPDQSPEPSRGRTPRRGRPPGSTNKSRTPSQAQKSGSQKGASGLKNGNTSSSKGRSQSRS